MYKIWMCRCCQLHRLACLNTSARRCIAWRWNWNICHTVVIFEYVWDSEILKLNILERWVIAFLNRLLNIRPTLHCSIGNDIFRIVSALKLVSFSDLLGSKSRVKCFIFGNKWLILQKCLRPLNIAKVNQSNFQRSS